jgi:ABC-type Fe3+-hydroxamate transport system substrate-binding protein
VRVVSLCPSITESVFRLGKGSTLVGRTKFCVQPVGEVDAIERVGGTKNPKLERIVALRPDLVFMNEEENRREDAEALRAYGVQVLSTFARDVAGAASSLREMGAALDARDRAEALAGAIERAAAELSTSTKARTRFVYLIWREPLMAAGAGTYVDALLTLASGDNVARSYAERYPEVELATLAEAEKILLSSEPFPFEQRHVSELANATQLPLDRFVLVDGELLSWHGARTLEGLRYAAQVFGD